MARRSQVEGRAQAPFLLPRSSWWEQHSFSGSNQQLWYFYNCLGRRLLWTQVKEADPTLSSVEGKLLVFEIPPPLQSQKKRHLPFSLNPFLTVSSTSGSPACLKIWQKGFSSVRSKSSHQHVPPPARSFCPWPPHGKEQILFCMPSTVRSCLHVFPLPLLNQNPQ